MEIQFIELFSYPDVILSICQNNIEVFHRCLELCQSSRQAILNLKPTFLTIFPNWGLKWPMSNCDEFSFFNKDTAIVNKQYFPIVPVAREFALIQRSEDMQNIQMPNLFILDLTDIKQNSSCVIGVVNLYGITVTYTWKENMIYAQISKKETHEPDSPPMLCSRSLPQFLSEMKFLTTLRKIDMGLEPETINSETQRLIDEFIQLLPRHPLLKYDFCTFCGQGRFDGYHGKSCRVCVVCPLVAENIASCSNCLERLNHVNKNHRHCFQNASILGRIDNPKSLFCDQCNVCLWNYPTLGLTCQHADRRLCLACAEKDRSSDCRFTLDKEVSGINCDGTACDGRQMRVFEPCWSRQNGNNTIDLCQTCYETEKNQYTNMLQTLAFGMCCCECSKQLRADKMCYFCPCRSYTWHCSNECFQRHMLIHNQYELPILIFQNGKIIKTIIH